MVLFLNIPLNVQKEVQKTYIKRNTQGSNRAYGQSKSNILFFFVTRVF